MAALEKLSKALDALKFTKDSSSSLEDETAVRRKKNMENCSVVADIMCSTNVKTAANFTSLLSYSMETLLQLCDDPDSDTRMIADESLNRIIRAMMDNNLVKVQVELHKEIKKNGSVRSLRAALSRFAQLAHMIRPQKGKAYIQNLTPCLVEIARRREEPVLETLAAALPHILAALGSFTTDNNIRDLLKSFLVNLSSDVPVIRRTAASSIVSVCLHSRKPAVFLSYTLNSLVDTIITAMHCDDNDTVLGVLNCVRLLLPHLSESQSCSASDTGLRGSFGARQNTLDTQDSASVDRLLQVYKLCLHFTGHSDHNIVTTALETLHQLLSCAPEQLLRHLLSPAGLGRSRSHNIVLEPGKLSRRTLSEMSVASSADQLTADSPLLDTQDENIQTSRLAQWVQNSSTPSQIDSASEESDAESTAGRVFVPVTPILVVPTVELAPSAYGEGGRDTPSPEPSPHTAQAQVWEIGDVSECDVPLLFCCRRLVTGFLLPDTAAGPRVRVSVRALALQCVTHLLRLQPQLFYRSLDFTSQATNQGFSHVSDVVFFATHSDPQIRGLTCVLIGSFIRSALTLARASFQQWFEDVVREIRSKGGTVKTITLDKLVDTLVNGLQDESSVCVRHSLTSVHSCLNQLLTSCDHKTAVPVLPFLIRTAANPYWLVKVKLLEIFGDLSFLQVYYVTLNGDCQTRVLHSVLLQLLGDEDNRVRKAAAEAVSKAVTNMYYPVDENRQDIVNSAATKLSSLLLSGLIDRYIERRDSSSLEHSLSRVVHLLTSFLLQSSYKHRTAGCCEALSILSVKFPPVTFSRAWHCSLAKPVAENKSNPSASGLLGMVVAMMTTSPLALDLDVHNWLLVLAGNLYTGLATSDLKNKNLADICENKQIWCCFHDTKLANLSELLLHHLMRLLCVFVRVLEEVSTGKNPTPSPLKRRPTRASSPAKVNSAPGEKEVNKEEKGKFGQFHHIPHYNKLFDNLRSAYNNYKTQLECSDKLAGLLGSLLLCLGQLLEFATLTESGRVAEEILQYLRTAVSLEPTASVTAVQQLLKSLFGSNKIAQWEEGRESLIPPSSPPSTSTAFYENVIQQPLRCLSLPAIERDDLTLLQNKIQREIPSHRKASSTFKGLMSGSNRQALASYIRLFEPMVIQALKQYTVTNNVQLQVAVLSLLTQLVQLRVNYCLLDSDQIFIEFVLKQFEFLEVGQIKEPEVLVPKIFEFLVHLSYEKNHSKPVVSVAKVIQLCDGLMASGQDPLTHCIPALSPVVDHVFMTTSSTSAWQVKTQRDVVLAMLLRLVEYPQVLSLLSMVLSADRSGEECKRWSHQTADVLMPLLTQGRVQLDCAEAVAALLNLLGSFLPRTLSPPDPILRVLFTSQLYEIELSARSVAVRLAMLLHMCGRSDEDSVLARLEDLKLCVREQSDDPLNASAANLNDPPQTVFARLLLRTLQSTASQLQSCVFCCHGNELAQNLEYLLAHLLLTYGYMFKSNSHQVITAGFLSLLEAEPAAIPELNQLFLSLRARCPLVVVLWCRLLTVINHRDRIFWSSIMAPVSHSMSKSSCLNFEVVQRGSVIVFCEFVAGEPELLEDSAWLLSRHFSDLMTLYSETPVTKFLEVCKSNPLISSLLLPAVATVCATNPKPQLVSRILDYLVSVSLDDSGSVLTILSSLLQHPHLVLARRAAALACSRVEYLLMLEREEVFKLLDQNDLLALLKTLTCNVRLASKHSGLVSLLNKLASTHYSISPVPNHARAVNTSSIHTIALDKAWFLSQVRLRCCQGESAQQCSQLLSQLDYADIESVLRCQQFNNCILQHCFTLGTQLTVQERKTRRLESGDTQEEYFSPLYSASRMALLQHIHHLHSLLPRMHQVYGPVGRAALPKESKYTDRLNELLSDCQFLVTLFRLVPAVTSYLHSLSELSVAVPVEATEDLAKFGVLCAEVVQWLLKKQEFTSWPTLVRSSLDCAASVLRLDQLTGLLSLTQLGSVTSTLSSLVHFATGNHLTLFRHSGEKELLEDVSSVSLHKLHDEGDDEDSGAEQEAVVSLHTRYQVAALVSWLEKSPQPLPNAPQFIVTSIRHMVRSLGRCSLLLWYAMTPPDSWPAQPPSLSQPPPLPATLLQDIYLLRQLIFRISLFGWTNRTQFEETWMSLLTVLSSSPGPDTGQDEIQAIMQSSSVAVQGITSLLVQTFLQPTVGNPNTGRLLHSCRDKPLTLSQEWSPKLEVLMDALYWRLQESHRTLPTSARVFPLYHRCNAERLHNSDRYGYGQVSVDFLKTAVMSQEERAVSSVNTDYVEHQKRIEESGLDLHSCIQFLLDLYSQWTQPKPSVPLALLLEVVRSTVTLSDLFTERSHFAWLLDLCLELSRTHAQEDEVLHQYLVVATCKAAAVLPTLIYIYCDDMFLLSRGRCLGEMAETFALLGQPTSTSPSSETEVCERVLRLLESGLRSVFPPARVAAVYGLLYLLEGYIHVQVEEQAGDTPTKTPDTRQRLLQLTKEHIARHFSAESSSVHSEESQLVLYSLIMYTLEHSPEELPPEVQSHLVQLVISKSSSRQIVLYQALVQGLRRLVMCDSGLLGPVTRVAMDRLGQSDPAVSLHALQLLLTCMYSGEYTKMKGDGGIIDPEQMVATIEKTSALFDRVKKGSPTEVECVCAALPFILADFFPASEVLTKVIGEFLSPQQPNHRHLSAVVFQVLSQACREEQLPLLQAWLVMSLHIFTQTLPVAMATWCLLCFFISASLNPWLRAMFPHVQSRMGRCTYEDRKLLCIAASDFYKQLTDEKQKETFLQTFKDASSIKSPFADVVSSL